MLLDNNQITSALNTFQPITYTDQSGNDWSGAVVLETSTTAASTIDVQSDSANAVTFVQAGNGDNAFVVSTDLAGVQAGNSTSESEVSSESTGNGTGTLAGIKGLLFLNAGTGNNSLLVSESGSTNPDVVYLTNNIIYSNNIGGFLPIIYQTAPGGHSAAASCSN